MTGKMIETLARKESQMAFEGKTLDAIEKSDLEQLVHNEEREKRILDYKQCLPGGALRDRKEFLADVSSFANAGGGHIVFGIKEKGGQAVELIGLGEISPEDEILRLEQLARSGIQPRIPSLASNAVPLANNTFAIVMHIPHSWALPHMVTLEGSSRFYSRNSSGKHPLDITEIRGLFALSESLAERARNFRMGRLARMCARETPAPIGVGSKLVLHIIPLNAFDPTTNVDLKGSTVFRNKMQPLRAPGWDHRYNFDGFLTFVQTPGHGGGYVQLFRSGIIEIVDADLIAAERSNKLLPIGACASSLLHRSQEYIGLLKGLGVPAPFLLALSLLNVRGLHLAVNPHQHNMDAYPIDRDDLIVPPVLMESYGSDLGATMRPAFDAVWNAGGYHACGDYDSTGLFSGKPFPVKP